MVPATPACPCVRAEIASPLASPLVMEAEVLVGAVRGLLVAFLLPSRARLVPRPGVAGD